jgi:hypothetical protein
MAADYTAIFNRHPVACSSMRASPKPELVITLRFGGLGILTSLEPQRIAEIHLFSATGTGSGSVRNLLGNIDVGMAFWANNNHRRFSHLVVTG